MHSLRLLLSIAVAADSRGPFDGLKFREIGPASPAGRIDDFAALESNPATFYVATATGGLWKTTNNGTTFDVLFDDQTTSSIGDVAIAPEDPNLVWVGTGENNNRQSSSWGDGIYKSTDGGKSWRNMGLGTSRHVARILVDPSDLDVVYVAALGSLFGPAATVGSTRPPTAVRAGVAFSTWTTTPARPISSWIRGIPKCSTPRRTRDGGPPGGSTAADREAGSIRPRMGERPGSS